MSEDHATFAFVDLACFRASADAHGDREAAAVLQAFRPSRVRIYARSAELQPWRVSLRRDGASAPQLLFRDATPRALRWLRRFLDDLAAPVTRRRPESYHAL